MTDRADDLTTPFAERLRDDLLDNLPRHRRRRRRRQVVLGAAAVVAVVAPAIGGEPENRGADVATVSTAPVTTAATATTGPAGVSPPPEPALAVVETFLDDLRRGDLVAAAGRWSGYPGAAGEDLAARVAGVEKMVDRLPWLADPAYVDRALDAPLWPGDHQVATVTASTGAGRPRKAAAFVVDRGGIGEVGAPDATIERLPSPGPTSTPAAGTTVARGQEIVVPLTLVEAVDVVAWFGGQEVTAKVAHGRPDDTPNGTVTVRVPDTASGQTVLTVLTSTPELPVAYAFWFRVG